MIQANELKVGNWVGHNSNWAYNSPDVLRPFKFQWSERDWYALGECTMSLEDLNPIPLTPEILEKAGFEVTKGTETSNYKFWCSIGFFEVRFKENDFTFYHVGGGCRTILDHIKHLHQVQNIYYEWTGQELEINLL